MIDHDDVTLSAEEEEVWADLSGRIQPTVVLPTFKPGRVGAWWETHPLVVVIAACVTVWALLAVGVARAEGWL